MSPGFATSLQSSSQCGLCAFYAAGKAPCPHSPPHKQKHTHQGPARRGAGHALGAQGRQRGGGGRWRGAGQPLPSRALTDHGAARELKQGRPACRHGAQQGLMRFGKEGDGFALSNVAQTYFDIMPMNASALRWGRSGRRRAAAVVELLQPGQNFVREQWEPWRSACVPNRHGPHACTWAAHSHFETWG